MTIHHAGRGRGNLPALQAILNILRPGDNVVMANSTLHDTPANGGQAERLMDDPEASTRLLTDADIPPVGLRPTSRRVAALS